MEKFQQISATLYLLLMMCGLVLGIPEYGKKCEENSKSKRLYGKTSDHDLYSSSLDISPIGANRQRESINFYDPSYGFSKESLADIGITEKSPESLAEESILQPDILPGKSYHRHVYANYPELLGDGYKSLLQQNSFQPSITVDSKLTSSYINPLAYLKNYVDKSKLEESGRIVSSDLDVFSKSNINANEYEQFLKDAYKKTYDFSTITPDYGHLFKNQKEESSYDPQFLWQGGKEARPFRQFSSYGKEIGHEDTRSFSELLEQSKAMNDYIAKFGGATEYEVNETDEFNTLKFREGDRPRHRRPPSRPRNKSPRQLPSPRIKLCIGTRCGNKIRRPRYTLY